VGEQESEADAILCSVLVPLTAHKTSPIAPYPKCRELTCVLDGRTESLVSRADESPAL
jgi:hypothetical protein